MFCYKDNGEWSADITEASDKATLEFSQVKDTSLDDQDSKTFVVEHVGSGESHMLIFKKSEENPMPEELEAPEKTDLENWVNTKFNSAEDKRVFRSADNKLKIRITGDSDDNARMTAVKTAVRETFDSEFKICEKVGRNWNGECISGYLDPAWFDTSNWEELKITLPDAYEDDPGKLIGADQAIYVEFGFEDIHSVGGCAWAKECKQVVTIPSDPNDTMPEEVAGSLASVICHELGHIMKMTILPRLSSEPLGMPRAEHVDNGGTYYSDSAKPGEGLRDNMHHGSHCAHGIADTSTGEKIEGREEADCIMYGQYDSEADLRRSFCDTCASYIKGRDLHDIKYLP